MMRVLVLGADEYIGQRVLLALADCDWARPVAGGRSAPDNHRADIARAVLDPYDPASLGAALRGADAVVNCLSGRPAAIADGATALFAAAMQAPSPPLIVHLSSMTVYGRARGMVDEGAPLFGDLGDYARAKIHAETLAAAYPRTVILRPGVEYGPGGWLWSGRVAQWLYAGRLGDLGAAGDGYCNLVHIDDLVAAAMGALRQPEAVGGVFNLAIADPPTWNEYFTRYAIALRAVPVNRISTRRLALEAKLLAPPLKALELAMGAAGLGPIVAPIPPSLLATMRQEIRLDCLRARDILGWRCKPLDQGLAETAAWFRRGQERRQRAVSTRSHFPADSP